MAGGGWYVRGERKEERAKRAGRSEKILQPELHFLRKLAHARSAKLEDNPAAGQVLLLGVVRYPLDLAPVTVGGRHGDGGGRAVQVRWMWKGCGSWAV